jgi:general secretion pathway protein G
MKNVRAGFTIIEIAVVVSVIAIIASIIIVSFTQVQKDSRDRDRTADILSLENALKAYFNDNNEYPGVCPSGDNYGCAASLLDPLLVPRYIPQIPKDPKGGDYSYVRGPVASATPAFGILVGFEGTAQCKAGVNVAAGWWGSSVPTCGAPL